MISAKSPVLSSLNASSLGITPTMLIMDPGASHSLTSKRVLFNTGSIAPCEPVAFNGVSKRGSAVVAREAGDILGFDNVLYSPDAFTTIISLSQYERDRRYKIVYSQDKCHFTIEKNGVKYWFTPHESGLKICDIAKPGAVTKTA